MSTLAHPLPDASRAPDFARALAYLGLLPFVLPTAALLFGPAGWHAAALDALRAYGAVILSFLGAVHWGLGLREPALAQQWHVFGWGVLPALTGWIALLLPASSGLTLLIGGYALQYGADRHATLLDALPLWYERLRLRLSVVMLGCLVLARVAP